MRAPRHETVTLNQTPDAVFEAVLGVAQNAKNVRILAVHNQGRKLVLREKAKMSNAKFQQIWVEEQGSGSQLNIVVGTDPRTQKALLDGKANEKSLKKYVEAVQAVLGGSVSAPVTPVENHYLAQKTEVPWEDPEQDPQIELDGNILAMYGL